MRFVSQSPYGAKPSATLKGVTERILRAATRSRNPLTGLNLLQPGRELLVSVVTLYKSQSPYGAKPSATFQVGLGLRGPAPGRNPLTGLNLLQLYPYLFPVLDEACGGGVCGKDEAWNMRR